MRTRVGGKIDKVLLRKIEKLSKENPNLPQLKNYLSVAYTKMGKFDKALETIAQLIVESPDYIYSRLTTILYAIEIKDLSLAEDKFAVFKDIDAEDSREEELEEMIESLKFDEEFDEEFDFEFDEESDEEFDEEFDEDDMKYPYFPEPTLNSPPVKDRNDAPAFHHSEIHQLYQLGFKNAMPVLTQILALPSATVIQDLELVLQDGIERYPYFKNQDWSVFTHSFPLHASFLLMELKAAESLTNVLDFIQYDEDFMELYFGDFLTEDFWQCIYILGKEKPTLLKDFLLKPGIYSFAKAAVSQALIQISILEPHRSQEIEKLFEEVFLFFIHCENRYLIDPTFLGLMIGDAADAQFNNVFHYIEKLYDLQYIDKSIEGNFENFSRNRDHKSEAGSNYKLHTLADIYSSADFCEEDEPQNDFFESPANESIITQMPIHSQKVNRNDPCPCGSGKKYKKCCG